MPPLDTIATTLATRLGATPAPAGYAAIRLATATPPQRMITGRSSSIGTPGQVTPVLLVVPDSGTFEAGMGTRRGVQRYLARLYYTQAAELAREAAALEAWSAAIVDQLKGAVQLAGLVTAARITSWRMALLPYNGQRWAGLELVVEVITRDSWGAVS